MLVAGNFQHIGHGSNRTRGANAVSSSRQAYAEPAVVGKPFQRVSDGPAIDDTRANASHGVPDVQLCDGLGITGADPAECHEYRADSQHQARPDDVDQISFKWN